MNVIALSRPEDVMKWGPLVLASPNVDIPSKIKLGDMSWRLYNRNPDRTILLDISIQAVQQAVELTLGRDDVHLLVVLGQRLIDVPEPSG